MDLKRILVAINSPNGRDAAFERALALARSSGAELYLLHAVPVNQPFSFRAAERLERIVDMRKRAEDAGVRVQTVEQHGDPAEIIELHANARGVDLIVMGGEARLGWGRHRSLVAERVIRRTNVPTLVVASDAPDSPTAFRNVLVALDLSPASEGVLKGAIGLTADEAVQLTVMHTVKGIEAADAVQSPARWMVPDTAHTSWKTRGEHSKRSCRQCLRVSTHACRCRRGRQLAQFSNTPPTRKAELVVVGRSRGFKMLGSTALRVLRKNERALLVIPSVAHRSGHVERQRAA